LRAKAREERRAIVAKYDLGREEGAVIDDWEDPKLELYHTQDRYGFIHDQRLPSRNVRDEKEKKQLEKEMSRLDKWVVMLKNPLKWFPPGSRHREKMVERVWKGTPLRCRGSLWRILLDLDRIKQEQEGKYQEMKELARLHSPDIRQIDLDVNRTYRNHSMFRERYNNRQQDLFHVLAAYSMYNSEVGYCQGMSQIAALLLMYLDEEEEAFWALSQLMVDRKYNMHGFFIPQFPRLMRFQEHHDKIMLKKLRRLQKHMLRNGVESGIYTLKWYFQCFLDRLPFSLVIRVWDLYILEGECIMFAMAYAILKSHRKAFMKMGMDEILELLQKTLETDFGYEDDYVVETILKECLQELKSARLHTAGQPPPQELPQKPFGLFVPSSVEEELGVRQPFSDKEREFSEHTIQRQADNARKLQHLNSQTSIDEGSFDHSLNETGSLEPDTEDPQSDLLEQDISCDSPPSTTGHTPLPDGPSHLNRASILPPSPLPPSKEQDELDKALLKLMKEANITSISDRAPVPRPASAEPGAVLRGTSSGRRTPGKKLNTRSAVENISGPGGVSQGGGVANISVDSRDSRRSRLGSDLTVSSRGGLNTSRESTQFDKRQSRESTASSEVRPTRSTSKGSTTSSTYYFGEAPDLNTILANTTATNVNGHNSDEEAGEDVLNTSHEGEVVRIKVNYDQKEDKEDNIERIQASEISPRFNGHKVTIKVNHAGNNGDKLGTRTGGSLKDSFVSRQKKIQEVSKHHITTTEKKVKSRGEKTHKTTHTMFVQEHSSSRGGSATDRLDRVVSQSQQYQSYQSQKTTLSNDGKVLRQEKEQWEERKRGGGGNKEEARGGHSRETFVDGEEVTDGNAYGGGVKPNQPVSGYQRETFF